LSLAAITDRKRESSPNRSQNILSGVRNKDTHVKENSLTNEIENLKLRDVNSALECNSDSKEHTSKTSLNNEKVILKLNNEFDNLHVHENSQYEFTRDQCQQPKSILRRISNEPKSNNVDTGKSVP